MQPLTLEERLRHIELARKQLGTRLPWLADSMDNQLKHAFGDKNNSEFVISPEGKVLIARTWSDPDQLRLDLENLVGKSETVTPVRKTGSPPERKSYARGVVPRVKRPSGATPLVVRPASPGNVPFYVKLRAEAPREVLTGGEGQLYLGFHLDPIHEVHWNNLAPPLTFTLFPPEGMELDTTSGEAPGVEEEADLDPREFLVGITGAGEAPLKLRVDYFACDDHGEWCKAVTQEYLIEFSADRDGGRVQGAGRGRERPGGQRRGMRPDPEQILSRMDTDGDGRITREEARGPMIRRFDEMDRDGDGAVSLEEIRSRFGR